MSRSSLPSAERLTPEQRTLRAKIAADERWSRVPSDQRRDATAAGRRTFIDRFLREVDRENPGLPDGERFKLADSKLRAHMTRLALKSSRSRRGRGETPTLEPANYPVSDVDGSAVA